MDPGLGGTHLRFDSLCGTPPPALGETPNPSRYVKGHVLISNKHLHYLTFPHILSSKTLSVTPEISGLFLPAQLEAQGDSMPTMHSRESLLFTQLSSSKDSCLVGMCANCSSSHTHTQVDCPIHVSFLFHSISFQPLQ